MKLFRNIFNLAVMTALCVYASSCAKEQTTTNTSFEFMVRTSELAHNYVKLSISHNGPEDITWYGALAEDVSKKDYEIFNQMYLDLVKNGVKGLKRSKERIILLENLEEEKKYKYIVFGIREDGTLYENSTMASIEFTTGKNIYVLTENDQWNFTYERKADGNKEIIQIKSNNGGRYAWNYVNLESLDAWNKEYPDGYELWEDGVYMTTVDAIEIFVLQEITNIHAAIAAGGKIEDYTYLGASDEPFEINRLQSGKYALIAFGFDKSGQHTQTYSIDTLEIKEETATAEYEKWLGTYKFKGKCDVNQDDGTVVEEEREYDITIEPIDNNFMYRVRGWECGESVKYDWEEDIMQLDKEKGEFLGFPAYYNSTNLEFRESPMTYITFDGVNALILGMYGYAYNESEKMEMPVLFDGTPMATATPIEVGESTELTALSGSYEKIKWTYSRMGYLAWNEYTGAYQTVNPAMKLPITITKVSNDYPKDADDNDEKIEEPEVIAPKEGTACFSSDIRKEVRLMTPDGGFRKIECPAVVKY